MREPGAATPRPAPSDPGASTARNASATTLLAGLILLVMPALAGCLGFGDDDPAATCDAAADADCCSVPCPAPDCVAAPQACPPPGAGPVPPLDGNVTGPPRNWTQPGGAAIRPGVQVFAGGGQCTSNFVFTSRDNATVYLGVAAHCFTDNDPNQAADGCDPASDPMDLNTTVEVEGAQRPAKLVYTSWGTMQAEGEGNAEACQYNDFALVELAPDDGNRTNPSMLFFGGPERLGTATDAGTLSKVLTYGNSGLRQGIDALSPHEGYVLFANQGGGWSTTVFTATPGIPGDSGSGLMLEDGSALGVVVTIQYTGGTNGVSSLDKMLAYARSHGGPDVMLARWDLATPGRLP